MRVSPRLVTSAITALVGLHVAQAQDFVIPCNPNGGQGLFRCEEGEGEYEITAFYNGAVDDFNIAITDVGNGGDEEYILNLAESEIGQPGVTRSGCFTKDNLYRFVVFDPAPEPSTSFRLVVNGKEIPSRSQVKDLEEYYFFGEEKSCSDGEGRFRLEIVFDDWPEEINWELKSILSQDLNPGLRERDRNLMESIVLSNEDTARPPLSFYSPEFNSDTLVVERCIGGGDYVFELNDAVDRLFPPGKWSIFMDCTLLRTGIGTPFEGPTPFSFNGVSESSSVGPTLAPVIFNAPISVEDKTESPLASGTPVSFAEEPPGEVFVCFPGSATVWVKDVGLKAMRDLKIGDYIAVGDGGTFEPVYSFGHHEPQGASSSFLEIRMNESLVLQVSPQHLVFSASNRQGYSRKPLAVPAHSIEVGDELVAIQPDGSSSSSRIVVESIKSVAVKGGLYSPFTPSGRFLVMQKGSPGGTAAELGVLVSSYMGFSASHNVAVLGEQGLLVNSQWLAHSFEFPHRVACYYLQSCNREGYDERGLSTWVALPLDVVVYVLTKLSAVPRTAAMLLIVCILLAFSALEMLLLHYALAFLVGLLCIVMLSRGRLRRCPAFRDCSRKGIKQL